MVQQQVQVGEVVDKLVVIDRGLGPAQAEAAPVGRDDGAPGKEIGAERIDDKLVGSGHIHPAMREHQRRQRAVGAVRTPAAHMVVNAAQGQGF
ncbi:hypothetical protein D3C71_1936520 [compost metagenome]